MTTTHRLKTWQEPFGAVAGGRKTFEWRKDDRGFAEGDLLILEEWQPATGYRDGGYYTGRKVIRVVGYVLRGPAFGVPEGWAVLSLRNPAKAERIPPATKKKKPRTVSPRVPAPKRIPAKTASRWVSVVSGGLPSLGKRR